MKQRCIENQTPPPDLEPGDTVDNGEFFRNLKKDHVAKRYAKDSDDNPRFGFKIRKCHWKYADHQTGPLSVNLRSCIHTEQCSIALQPDGEAYFHVAVLDLRALNESGLISSQFVAQYLPIDEAHNRCHFEIMPLDGTVLQWMQLGACFDTPFPSACKLPAVGEEENQATAALKQFCSYCRIVRWVRQKDGTFVQP
jgi:hypothetical protein